MTWTAIGPVALILAGVLALIALYGELEYRHGRARGLAEGRARGHKEGHRCQHRNELQSARELAAQAGDDDLVAAIDQTLWELG